MTAVDLETAFEQLAASLDRTVGERSFAVTSSLAETLGLKEVGDGTPSQDTVWERSEGDQVLRFEWRWRDQSRTFSTRPDLNTLTVTLLAGGKDVRSASGQYED